MNSTTSPASSMPGCPAACACLDAKRVPGILRIRFIHSSNQIPCSSNVLLCRSQLSSDCSNRGMSKQYSPDSTLGSLLKSPASSMPGCLAAWLPGESAQRNTTTTTTTTTTNRNHNIITISLTISMLRYTNTNNTHRRHKDAVWHRYQHSC